MWYSGYLYCKSSFNYISLNSRSGQVQILLTGCRRFSMGEELWQWYRIEIRLDARPSSPIQKKQFMIISLLYSLHSLVSPVSLQKWIFVNSDQKLWKADIKASADIQFCLVFCLYFLLFYRYSRIVDVFFIVGLRARGQPDLDTIFFIRFPEALWFCNRM